MRSPTGPDDPNAARPPLQSPNQSPVALATLFARLMAALRPTMPFERAELVRFLGEHDAVTLALETGEPVPREIAGAVADLSDVLRPAVAAIVDAPAERLEATCAGDLRWLEAGCHSIASVPLRVDHQVFGVFLVGRSEGEPFEPATLASCLLAAEFLAVAAEHDRLWLQAEERHRRRARLESLLPMIAQTLDVRTVFAAMSPVIREVVPHDVLAFALLLPDRTGVRVQAATEDGVMELPPYLFSDAQESLDARWGHLLAYDLSPAGPDSLRVRISPRTAPVPIEVEIQPGERWVHFLTLGRIRSVLRISIRAKDEPIGGIAFLSRRPDTYDGEDGLAASRIADHIALALAHHDLAEDQRRIAVAEERARQLEERDLVRRRRLAALETALGQLWELQDLEEIGIAVSRIAQGILAHDSSAVAVIHSNGAHLVGLLDGDQRLSFEVPTSFVQDQYEELMPTGTFRLHDLEVIDPSRRLVRQHIARGEAITPREMVVPESGFQSIGAVGVRSELRAAVRQGDELEGVISFASRTPGVYSEEDEAIAARIARSVSLRLAKSRVEGEQQRAREASERARALEDRVAHLQRELDRFSAHRAIGRSAAWKKALADATQVAATGTTVLVTGESGTGKEVIARFIHRGSDRANAPFVALNCAALPEQLLESELFGHERGAFTGAHEARPGRIEQAAGGVLFLDEVGEMSPVVQAKFLRVLQEREFQRVGGTRTLKADVRIVAATNRDPRAGIAAGTFREDLYYRLGVFEIHLPPLRERPEDILALAEAFLDEVGSGIGRPAAGISEDAREKLLAHAWPGNVRELRNAIERAVILCHGGLVTHEHLPISVARPIEERVAMATSPEEGFPTEGIALGEVERDLLVKAMAKAGQNKSQAAKLLGLSRGQLYSLLRRHGLTEARR